MLDVLLVLLDDLPLLSVDVKHDIKLVDNVLDLPLEHAFGVDIEEGHNEVIQINGFFGVGDIGELFGPTP